MSQWEYRTVKLHTGGFLGGKVDDVELQEQLNAYGFDGWELVSTFDTSLSQGGSREIILIFKRSALLD
ncbi:DUF4177 domain-containing protein [Paenibacillus sp. PK4536]|uniref:DUF4177 domain-containing protein n=1 Tax=Paenibacillus nuruki TaxID=1886670 RepID=A0A1E3L3K9_9BACL|nr:MULTISPECIES: DUF4177 domain-containing protein [Paenibacillus]ODP27755.1 hypothetical protein PTI45_02778 [Paenibacillus nuruki]TKJ87714.1 DUF4177 domain-containing protein [Paenibacillus sp. CFBP13512]WIM38062.1 DUF4177 domain-containing protein [Paenibacillus sp. PK4536]CAJ1315280.1 DUF4177 domain-containing protein [Paenibacillus nuruki]